MTFRRPRHSFPNTHLNGRRSALWRLLPVLAGGALTACQAAPSALAPAGPAASRIADLGWYLLVTGSLVWLGVMILLGLGLWRRRDTATHDDGPPPPPDPALAAPLPGNTSATTWIVGGGIVMPALLLTLTYGLTLGTLRAVADQTTGDFEIEVVGHQWWWEVHYPDHGFTTANEIHIPAGQPVTLRMQSADVIHSFWVPELHGKIDLLPETVTHLRLEAAQPGEYRGQCAEFCGRQHAKMALLVIAQAPADFEAWATGQQAAAPAPQNETTEAGLQVFLNSACVYCHTIRGTNASGFLGPDLTHLASRRTLAANTLLYTRGHLAGWIIDPQTLKPGNHMPPTDLSSNELQWLLAYLDTLE